VTAMTGVPPEVTEYLAAVRAALDDLPPTERDDLLAEVEPSLLDAASETGGQMSARLGPPEEFAAELRAAAGLHAPPAAAGGAPRLLDLVRRLARHPRLRELRRLAPIWWVVRGYLAVAAIAVLAGADWSIRYFLVPHVGTAWLGILVILAAILLSIWIGLRTGRSNRLLALVNLVVLAGAVPVVSHFQDRQLPVRVVQLTLFQPTEGLTLNGVPVNNIYPYSRSGRLLHDVLLYTGAGVPLDAAGAAIDPQRRILRTQSGKQIFNAYPVRYFDPGTGEVAHPNAGPRVHIPQIETPPLHVGK
jgi:HAAS domain-containing protein